MFDFEKNRQHAHEVDEYIFGFKDTPQFEGFSCDEKQHWEFAANRLKGLGGSDIAAVMGLSKWKTPFQLWQEKTLRVEPGKLAVSNEFMYWGTLLEDVIAREYFSHIGHYYGELARSLEISSCPDLPMLQCNLDGAIKAPDGSIERVIEIKTAMTNAYSGDYDAEGRAILNWGEGNRYVERVSGLDCHFEDPQIPTQYRLQVEAYMMASGAQVADVVVLIGHHDFRVFTVHANPTLQTKIIAAANEFWDLVLSDTAPELVAADYETHSDNGDCIAAPADIMVLVDELVQTKAEERKYTTRKKELEDLIKGFIGDKSVLTDARGKPLCTWKKSPVKMKFDAAAFEKDNPEMYAKYMRPSKVSRTFLVKVK